MDVTLASTALVLVAPAAGATALAVAATLGRPVLFRQQRPGRYATPFTIFKFRTMKDLRDGDGRVLSDRERLTRIGRTIRSLSLDEVPQLLNVLKGEMSLVGPRPLLMQYLPLYTERQASRHDVLPGITGWAQVHGRNALTHEQRFELDVWYVENWSLWLDARILWMTLVTVLRRDGINAEGDVTMPEFRGQPGRFVDDRASAT